MQVLWNRFTCASLLFGGSTPLCITSLRFASLTWFACPAARSESCSASDVHPYDEVQGIMSALSFKSVKMAVAASSASPDTAQKALKRLGLGKLLHSQVGGVF